MTQDDRIVKQESDPHVKVNQSESRKDRSAEDVKKVVDDSMAAKIAVLRQGWDEDMLPRIEGDPNYHYCWLSTTNQSDPIYRRLRIGYELVRHEEVSYLGLQNRVQSGEFEGCVSINEMILSKIPQELYQELMLINHYERPMQEEELLRANIVSDELEKDSKGQTLAKAFGKGIDNLGKRPIRRPTFE